MAKKTTRKAKSPPRAKAKAISSEALFEHLNLRYVRLINVKAQLHISGGQIPNVAEINTTSSLLPGADGNSLHVNTSVSLTGKPEGGKEGCSLVLVEAMYQCVYGVVNAEIDELQPHAEAICANGQLVSWPLLRELVSSLTMRMQVPPFILPLFSVGPGVATLAPHEPRKEKKSPKKRTRI